MYLLIIFFFNFRGYLSDVPVITATLMHMQGVSLLTWYVPVRSVSFVHTERRICIVWWLCYTLIIKQVYTPGCRISKLSYFLVAFQTASSSRHSGILISQYAHLHLAWKCWWWWCSVYEVMLIMIRFWWWWWVIDDDLVLFVMMMLIMRSVKFFSKLNYLCFGYFDPINIFFDNQNKKISGWPEQYFG